MFLPFSFYYVRDVQIDIKNYTADIYLETIGKKEILEEEIKKGKEIEYNQNENIIQITGMKNWIEYPLLFKVKFLQNLYN